jgi:CRP/FNR family cyclic AMP-dependent transcriptional regulator
VAFAQEYGITLPTGDVTIPIRLTQSDLSGLIGATRVRVNQVLMVYKQRKFISISPNYHITIHSMSGLTRYFNNLN